MNKKHHISSQSQDQPSKQPFRVPDGYFETLEDRIEARIANNQEDISQKGKLIRMIKPLLAMAASFAVIFMLVYYPMSIFLPDYLAKNAEKPVEQNETNQEEEAFFSYLSISHQTFYDVLNSEAEQAENKVTADEMLDYLATAMNETEIYAELKN